MAQCLQNMADTMLFKTARLQYQYRGNVAYSAKLWVSCIELYSMTHKVVLPFKATYCPKKEYQSWAWFLNMRNFQNAQCNFENMHVLFANFWPKSDLNTNHDRDPKLNHNLTPAKLSTAFCKLRRLANCAQMNKNSISIEWTMTITIFWAISSRASFGYY